jgi:hypothetical protein
MHSMLRATLRGLLLVSVSVAVTAVAAAPRAGDDPLDSAGCRSALEALQAEEDALVAQHAPRDVTPADPKLLAARRDAARACLAARLDPAAPPAGPPPAGRLAQPPIAVAPVGIAAAHARAMARAPSAPATPVAPQPVRPQSIVACDAGGCWANDGTHLERFGPALSAGSRGLCTQQGALLTCP